jgi:hypothetical protein
MITGYSPSIERSEPSDSVVLSSLATWAAKGANKRLLILSARFRMSIQDKRYEHLFRASMHPNEHLLTI